MNEHIEDLLPFYANRTLAAEQLASCEAHLATCSGCRSALSDWERLESVVIKNVSGKSDEAIEVEAFPPLSPVVTASLRPKPAFIQAFQASLHLIIAQRVFLKGWLLPVVSVVLLTGLLVDLNLKNTLPIWIITPLFILVPFIAALTVAFLPVLEGDQAIEIVAATPTPPAILIYARLTLSLGVITVLALFASFFISGFDRVSLVWLVSVWLGPMLWLSALATLFAILWNPTIAAGITLSIWGGIILLLASELQGTPIISIPLEPLLYPDWQIFGAQLILACLLWIISWLWLSTGVAPSLRSERDL